MNTNGNAYTVIYTTIVVTLVAAILAFVAMTLKPKQDANIKAETISQMLTAAQFFTKDECYLPSLIQALLLNGYRIYYFVYPKRLRPRLCCLRENLLFYP